MIYEMFVILVRWDVRVRECQATFWFFWDITDTRTFLHCLFLEVFMIYHHTSSPGVRTLWLPGKRHYKCHLHSELEDMDKRSRMIRSTLTSLFSIINNLRKFGFQWKEFLQIGGSHLVDIRPLLRWTPPWRQSQMLWNVSKCWSRSQVRKHQYLTAVEVRVQHNKAAASRVLRYLMPAAGPQERGRLMEASSWILTVMFQ